MRGVAVVSEQKCLSAKGSNLIFCCRQEIAFAPQLVFIARFLRVKVKYGRDSLARQGLGLVRPLDHITSGPTCLSAKLDSAKEA